MIVRASGANRVTLEHAEPGVVFRVSVMRVSQPAGIAST